MVKVKCTLVQALRLCTGRQVQVTVGLSELMHRTEQLLRPKSGSNSTTLTREFFTIFLNSLALTQQLTL